MHPMTIRLPDDLYEHYRHRAFDSRTSMTALIICDLTQMREIV